LGGTNGAIARDFSIKKASAHSSESRRLNLFASRADAAINYMAIGRDGPELQRLDVLVVDDEPADRELLDRIPV
jgi:hypothetical protein